jgi:hypothetical protein
MFIDRKQIDARTNLQLHDRNQAKLQQDDKINIGYNPKDSGF